MYRYFYTDLNPVDVTGLSCSCKNFSFCIVIPSCWCSSAVWCPCGIFCFQTTSSHKVGVRQSWDIGTSSSISRMNEESRRSPDDDDEAVFSPRSPLSLNYWRCSCSNPDFAHDCSRPQARAFAARDQLQNSFAPIVLCVYVHRHTDSTLNNIYFLVCFVRNL